MIEYYVQSELHRDCNAYKCTDYMNGKVCGVLVQFGCYQHRYEWKGLWCSCTVWLLSA